MGLPTGALRIRRSFAVAIFLSYLPGANAGTPCNGYEEFCSLPLSKYTFPGTHNSGSSEKLNPPSGHSVDPSNQECFMDNHERSYTEQLDRGIRMLSVDMCVIDDELVNCHKSQFLGIVHGESISDSLDDIAAWMAANPNEVILLEVSNVHPSGGEVRAKLTPLIQSLFGTCIATNSSVTAQASLSCVEWPGVGSSGADLVDVTSVTLGMLLGHNIRLIYADGSSPIAKSTWSSSQPTTVEDFKDYIIDYASRDISPYSLVRYEPTYQGFQVCKEPGTQQFNEGLFASDSAAADLQGSSALCNNAAGEFTWYRTHFEVAQAALLARSPSLGLGSVNIDYSKYGDWADTITRMNFINVRHMQGARDPSCGANPPPTMSPTSPPTLRPTSIPSLLPTTLPTPSPTLLPTASPTPAPTSPTTAPTVALTQAPTAAPTKAPTGAPGTAATRSPTEAPTAAPTKAPTGAPGTAATPSPTQAPTAAPTKAPTGALGTAATPSPTQAPTAAPTNAPTGALGTAATPSPTQAESAADNKTTPTVDVNGARRPACANIIVGMLVLVAAAIISSML